MSIIAFNKIDQTQDLFKKIITPLKQSLGLSFGYMIVFNDGSYYQIINDMQCLKQFVAHVDHSHIFCERNVTNYFDKEYNFTLWPKIPACNAMKMYHQYNMRDGITVSKRSSNYTQLYWFTDDLNRIDGHKFFIRNKPLLLEFIRFFDSYKKLLLVPESSINSKQELFKFSQGFIKEILISEYTQQESCFIKSFFSDLNLHHISIKLDPKKATLSCREIEVLSMICKGYTAKIIAQRLDISAKTVEFHIGRMKQKTGLYFKTDLIQLYESHFG